MALSVDVRTTEGFALRNCMAWHTRCGQGRVSKLGEASCFVRPCHESGGRFLMR